MSESKNAMIALSLTERDKCLLEHSAIVCHRMGIQRVYLAHITPTLDLPPQMAKHLDSLRPTDEEIADRLQAAVQQYGRWDPSTDFHPEVREGAAQGGLMKLVRQKNSDLLCLGPAHRGQTRVLSTQAQRMLRQSPCSVLAVPCSREEALQKVLVPIDFSEHSLYTLRTAAQLLESGSTELIAQHVYDVPVGFDKVCSFEEFSASLLEHAKQNWSNWVKKYPEFEKISVRYDLIPHEDRSHDIPHIILKTAESLDVDLIVCGSRGLSRLATLVLGSTMEALVQRSNRPLLCVKHKGETHGLLDVFFDALNG